MRQSSTKVLLRNAWIAVFFVALFCGAALLASALHAKQYTASSALVFREETFGEELFGSEETAAKESARKAATNEQLIGLPQIASQTAAHLPGSHTADEVRKAVEIQIDPDSNVVQLNATDRDPDLAAEIANTYAEQFVEFRRSANRQAVRQAIQRAKDTTSNRLLSSGGDEAKRTLDRSIAQLRVLDTLETGDIEHVEPAEIPTHASSPRTARDVLLAAVVGLVLGAVATIVITGFDRRIRSTKVLEGELGVRVLSAFTTADGSGPSTPGRLPTSPISGVDMLLARLRYFNVDREIKTLLVTSSVDGEGKTTLAWSLASEATAGGVKAILVEADLQLPSVAGLADCPAGPGLTEHLSGQATLAEVVRPAPPTVVGASPSHPALITAGGRAPNAARLFESRSMRELLKTLQDEGYELIVIDAAPLTARADGLPLVPLVDGVIVVGRIGTTTQIQARALGDRLRAVNAPVLGAVANAASPRDRYAATLGARFPAPAGSGA